MVMAVEASPGDPLSASPLNAEDPLYIVIDGTRGRGQSLKASLQFMDVSQVCVANADDWQEALGERRLAAIFVGDDLDAESLRDIAATVGEVAPNAPIVRVKGGRRSGGQRE